MDLKINQEHLLKLKMIVIIAAHFAQLPRQGCWLSYTIFPWRYQKYAFIFRAVVIYNHYINKSSFQAREVLFPHVRAQLFHLLHVGELGPVIVWVDRLGSAERVVPGPPYYLLYLSLSYEWAAALQLNLLYYTFKC